MRHRTAGDLMTRPVVHVQRHTPFKDIAKSLLEDDVSAAPVMVGLCQGVNGVVEVPEHLNYRHDDTAAGQSQGPR